MFKVLSLAPADAVTMPFAGTEHPIRETGIVGVADAARSSVREAEPEHFTTCVCEERRRNGAVGGRGSCVCFCCCCASLSSFFLSSLDSIHHHPTSQNSHARPSDSHQSIHQFNSYIYACRRLELESNCSNSSFLRFSKRRRGKDRQIDTHTLPVARR